MSFFLTAVVSFHFRFFFVVLLKCWPGELHGRPVLVSCPLFSPRYIDSLLLSIKTFLKTKEKTTAELNERGREMGNIQTH